MTLPVLTCLIFAAYVTLAVWKDVLEEFIVDIFDKRVKPIPPKVVTVDVDYEESVDGGEPTVNLSLFVEKPMADWKQRALEAEKLLEAERNLNTMLRRDYEAAAVRAMRNKHLENALDRIELMRKQWKEADNA